MRFSGHRKPRRALDQPRSLDPHRVPRAALVILAGTLSSFRLPMEGVAVLLGIDAVMDMARTSVNVLGNCLASAVVARWEGVGFRASAVRDPLPEVPS